MFSGKVKPESIIDSPEAQGFTVCTNQMLQHPQPAYFDIPNTNSAESNSASSKAVNME